MADGNESPMLRIVHILKSLMMESLVGARGFGSRGSARVVRFGMQLCLSLRDRVSGVVVRIGFVVRAIIGDALDNFFWVVTTR